MNLKGSVMPKSGVALLAAGLSATVIATGTAGAATAAPAVAAVPAPTNVKVQWADATYKYIRVTWEDAGEVNWISSDTQDGDKGEASGYATAGAANEVLLWAGSFWRDEVMRVSVHSGQGTERSAKTHSAWFDTTQAPRTHIRWAIPQANGGLAISWYRDAVQKDLTPGDPLDQVSDPDRLTPGVWIDGPIGGPKAREFPVPSGTKAALLPAMTRAYPVTVISRNEWGIARGQYDDVWFGTAVASASIPASGTYGEYLKITGTVGVNTCPRYGNVCVERQPDWSIPVHLQARANAGSAWQTVVGVMSYGGKFTINAISPGTRQYRVYVPAWGPANPEVVAAAGAGEARTSVTRYGQRAIGFGTPSATYGQRVTARLTVAPGNDLRSTLQRWDGEKWVSIKWVYLKKGAGAYTFTATQRGLNAYRFVVPSSTYAGRAIATTITSKFYLAVR